MYPFDTNLIYTLYATKDLNNGKDIMEIEDVTGEYIFKLHKLFNRHNYYLDKDDNLINNLKVTNDNYRGDFISVDEELFNVLKSAVEITKFSDGKFNLFIGELSSFWEGVITGYLIALISKTTITRLEKTTLFN